MAGGRGGILARMAIDESVADCARDAIALLRAYNAGGGELDEDARFLLEHANLPGLVDMLLGMTYEAATAYAELRGHTSDEEARAAVDAYLASLQAGVIGITETGGGEAGGSPG
jgi:hypothetical protein